MNIRKQIAVFVMVMACTAMLTSTAWASEGGSVWDTIKDTASDAADTIAEKAPELLESAKETGSELVDKAKEKVPELLEAAQEGLEEAQETVTDLRQQQEDQFWGWFTNQINPQESASTSDNSSDQGTTEAPSGQDATPGKESTEAKDDEALTTPPVYYYDPNTVDSTASEDPTTEAAADKSSATAEEHPEESPASSGTTSESQPSDTASNALPQITPQTDKAEKPERAPSSLAERVDAWLSVGVKIAIIAAILLLGAAAYHKISKL